MKYDVTAHFYSEHSHSFGNMEEDDFLALIKAHNRRRFWLTDTAVLDLSHVLRITWYNEERHF